MGWHAERVFEFVMFWDDVAWVAGPTDFYHVSQGRTPDECIDNLQRSLQMTAEWNLLDGREPFNTRRDESDPGYMGPSAVPDEFRDTERAYCYEPGEETGDDHDRSYTGQLTVGWNRPTEQELRTHRARQKRGDKKNGRQQQR
jgi:hypothetical protein